MKQKKKYKEKKKAYLKTKAYKIWKKSYDKKYSKTMTLIRISPELLRGLDKHRKSPREHYHNIISRLLREYKCKKH
ncbi:MAG: hypothetical protein NT076_01295 [Candidatus Pacearchaeota archaeon]|nr:hypothetical protein [Candidatus Pacearchaeota archaeon]